MKMYGSYVQPEDRLKKYILKEVEEARKTRESKPMNRDISRKAYKEKIRDLNAVSDKQEKLFNGNAGAVFEVLSFIKKLDEEAELMNQEDKDFLNKLKEEEGYEDAFYSFIG